MVSIAFEFLLVQSENEYKVDEAYLHKKLELYAQTFPNYELLGWFHILPNLPMLPVEQSLSLHEQISQVCDNPILMVMDPEKDSQRDDANDKQGENSNSKEHSSSDLPLRAYEPIHRDLKIEFVEIPVRVETGEAERIAVDDIVKGAEGSYGLSSHLSTQNNALRMFHQRLKVLRDYTNGVQNGKFQPDYDLLRRINSFAYQLSKQTRSDLVTSFHVQELDAMVAALMAMVMKSERDKFDLNKKWMTLRTSKKAPLVERN